MGDTWKKTRERLENEFTQVSSVDKWTKEHLENMKNILKSMYYIDVICAMKHGEEEDDEEYNGGSYGRGQRRNSMGRYYDGRYPMTGPYYDNRSMNNGNSGRRYYDGDHTAVQHRLESMMQQENDPEMRMAMQEVLSTYQRR